MLVPTLFVKHLLRPETRPPRRGSRTLLRAGHVASGAGPGGMVPDPCPDHMRVAVRQQQDVARVPPEWSVAAPLEGAVAPTRRLAPRNSTTSEDANARRSAAPPTPAAH